MFVFHVSFVDSLVHWVISMWLIFYVVSNREDCTPLVLAAGQRKVCPKAFLMFAFFMFFVSSLVMLSDFHAVNFSCDFYRGV